MKVTALRSKTAALRATFATELPIDQAAKVPPTEFRIFGRGDNPSEKGTFVFDDIASEMVMRKWAERGVPMGFDYEHQSVSDPPIEAPAAGWFTPQVRDGELWATDIHWNDRARAYLESGEYRLFSPAFGFEEMADGRMRVTKLINVALTNNPALHNIEPLVAAKDKDDDMDEELKKLQAQLAAKQAECEALTARVTSLGAEVASLKAKFDKDEDGMKATAALRDEVQVVTGKTDSKEQVGVLRALKMRAEQGDQAVAKLREIEQGSRDTEYATLHDAAFREGKISPAQRKDYWDKVCKADGHVTVEGLAQLKAFLPTASVQVAVKETAQREGGGQPFSKDQAKVMDRFGITSPEEREAFNKFRLGQSQG